MPGYTEEDLRGLSAAERAILEADDEDGSEDELRALAEEEVEDAEDAGGKAAVVTAVAASSADEAGKAGDAEPEEEEPAGPASFTPETPADAAQTREAMETKKAEAFQKLMDGEIDADAYRAIDKEVSAQLEDLLGAAITDRVTAKLTQAELEKSWKSEIKGLYKAASVEGIDYAKNEDARKELDGLVRVFGAEAIQRGMTDDGLKASKWALKQAHDVMKVRHGKPAAAPAAAPSPAPGKASRAPDLSGLPPSLSKVPVAADQSITSEFAHLDSLTGAALERAVARLTPEQLERYAG